MVFLLGKLGLKRISLRLRLRQSRLQCFILLGSCTGGLSVQVLDLFPQRRGEPLILFSRLPSACQFAACLLVTFSHARNHVAELPHLFLALLLQRSQLGSQRLIHIDEILDVLFGGNFTMVTVLMVGFRETFGTQALYHAVRLLQLQRHVVKFSLVVLLNVSESVFRVGLLPSQRIDFHGICCKLPSQVRILVLSIGAAHVDFHRVRRQLLSQVLVLVRLRNHWSVHVDEPLQLGTPMSHLFQLSLQASRSLLCL
mmetsp:Transcript_24310/g.63820  ORF Transcript_24310/g.63820 Transcript_24310/m.63820 type:complete len:255 (-) Transcript_24310:330-1094(-)